MVMKQTTKSAILDTRPEGLEDRIHTTNERKPLIRVLAAEHAKTVGVLRGFEAIDHDERRKRKESVTIGFVHVRHKGSERSQGSVLLLDRYLRVMVMQFWSQMA